MQLWVYIKLVEDCFQDKQSVEKPKITDVPSNLAMVGRYIFTPDIFDKIRKTELGVDGEIQLTDAISKLDDVYGVLFEGKTYNVATRFDWLRVFIVFGLEDSTKDELIEYMKLYALTNFIIFILQLV